MIYRFHHSMYYANAEHFSQEVLELVNSAQPPLAWFCIDATAVDEIDFSAAATLRETYKTLKEKGVRWCWQRSEKTSAASWTCLRLPG